MEHNNIHVNGKKKYTNRYYENEMFTATLLFNLLLFKERKKEEKKTTLTTFVYN